ncbi:MAG: redoxin domain-containing protein [Candidatus Omnitrophica bacterium]|nr:redoxin domain-containing protein [Candidatus Omnitrophota bacterium]
MLRIGQQVPEIEFSVFHSEDVRKVRLTDWRGKWLVLIFYPADFTFICPTELEEAAHLYPQFQKIGAEIVSVSTDTVYVHKAWHDQSPAIKKIKFPMAADPAGKLCRAFGTMIEEEGLSVRGSFIVDPDGILQVSEMHANNIGRSVQELLRKLQAAQFVRENKGEVCPVNWKPGQKTLKPGLDLVGKI